MTRATLAKAPADVAAMFDGVARRYDVTNAVLTTGGTLAITDVDSPATFVAQTKVAGAGA